MSFEGRLRRFLAIHGIAHRRSVCAAPPSRRAMRRKPTRAASSSAAAARLSDAPTFTSFAAATAHALPTHPTAQPVPTTTPWDETALQILRRLSKRDATTKQRALAHLSAHIDGLHHPVEGRAFVAAWESAFRVALDDDAPPVRAAAVAVMPRLVRALKNHVHTIFSRILPPWVAATADPAPIVAEAAVKSLGQLIATPTQREKLIARYAHVMRDYVTALLAHISPPNFLVHASRTIAVLAWLLAVAQRSDVIAPVIDDPGNPLLMLAKGMKKSDASVAAEVCTLAIDIVSHMKPGNEADVARAARFAELSVVVIRMRKLSGWDLALILYRSGWHHAFGERFGKLPDVVRQSVTASMPVGLQALLPLMDALPPIPDSAAFASRVLDGMAKVLNITSASNSDPSCSVSYMISALPAFLETCSFIHDTAAKRWFADHAPDLLPFQHRLSAQYMMPACCAFLSGRLPSVLVPSSGNKNDPAKNARPQQSRMSQKLVRDVAKCNARLLRSLDERNDSGSFSLLAQACIGNAVDADYSERLLRLDLVLGNIDNADCGASLALCVVQELMKTKTLSTESTLKFLAVVLEKRAGSAMVTCSTCTEKVDMIESDLYSFAQAAVVNLSQSEKLKGPTEESKHLGNVYSWLFWAAATRNDSGSLPKIVDGIRSSCTAEESFLVLGTVIRANESRKSLDHVSSWRAIQGTEVDELVLNAASIASKSKSATTAGFLVASAVDPGGGCVLCERAQGEIADLVVQSVSDSPESSIFDEVITLMLRSPVCHSDSNAGSSFQRLTAVSILRAQNVNSIMPALLGQLESSTTENVVKRVHEMIDVLRDKSLDYSDEGSARHLAVGLTKVISLTGARSVEKSVEMCGTLFSFAATAFILEFLKNTPFRIVFGYGGDVPIHMDFFTETLEKTYGNRTADVVKGVKTFVGDVEDGEKMRMATDAADRFLSSGDKIHRFILDTVLEAIASATIASKALSSIGQKLRERVPDASQCTKEYRRIPEVIVSCSLVPSGVHGESFRDLLDAAVRIIRQDAFSPLSGTAIDMLTACFHGDETENSKESAPPSWLTAHVSLALRAVRRSFELSHNVKREQLRTLGGYGARLMQAALVQSGDQQKSEDDVRFWVIHCTDSLRAFVREHVNEPEVSPSDLDRIPAITSLSAALIDAAEKRQTNLKIPSGIDALSHWGATAAILLLPSLPGNDPSRMNFVDIVSRSDVGNANKLILTAAENGTLLNRDGGLSVSHEHVYRMTPQLSSSSSLSRKAGLIALTYGAMIDLHNTAPRSFPEGGFTDEKDEAEFAKNLIPNELCEALGKNLESQTTRELGSQDPRCLELGYFLAWRLFLDLIRADDPANQKRTTDGEDTSFRRVGLTFLRSNPTMYAQFFRKCVEVVVDGSSTEQASAAIGASTALEVEENNAQGIQLAQKETASGTNDKRQTSDSDDIESAVGHAAGVSFARALQRLPALSRNFVTDRLDRGTASRVETFVRTTISPLLIAAEIRKVKEWGAFGGGAVAQGSTDDSGEGELHARGSVAGREVWATYTFSDVTLEIGMRLPDTFPLQSVEVEARSRIGMSEARWRKTLLGMTTLLRSKDGTLAEAVEVWRRNLDKTFQGAEECPICYSVLHLSTAALPKMQCRTCKNLFHSDCLCKWFTKSNSSACPLCRSAF